MMGRNFYLSFVATVMLLSLILLGVILINAVDRLHFDCLELNKKLTGLQDTLREQRIAVPQTQTQLQPAATKPAEVAATASFANAEFFDPAAVPGDRMISVIMSDVGNMNYLINNDSGVSNINSMCNVALAERNYRNPDQFEPLLAESWDISLDHKVYHIKLRKGIIWHDFTDPVSGKEWKDKEVTAHDFKFYVDVIKNPDTNCAPLRVYYKDLTKVEIISDYEFKVYWSKPYFQSMELTLGLSPLPRHLYHAYDGPFDGKKFNDDHQRNRILIGCGPYRMANWEKDRRIVLTKWEKYIGAKYGAMPPVDTVVFEVIKHPSTSFQSLLSGTVDRLGLQPEQWINRTNTPEFGENGKIRKLKYLSRSFSYVGYNLKNPLFSDKRVRQALSHLINREKILKDIYFGLGEMVSGGLFYDSPYYDKSIKPYSYDIEKAKTLLAAAGWEDHDKDGILDKDGKRFEFTIIQVANHPIQQKMLPLIKEDMAKAGIDMKIQTFEWSVYIQRIEQKNFEACTLGWTISYDPDLFQLWHSSEADKPFSSNHIGFKNAEADQIIEELRTTFDVKKRIELCWRFQRLLHEEQPYSFLFSPYTLMALSSRYKNVQKFQLSIPLDIIWTPKADQLKVPGM